MPGDTNGSASAIHKKLSHPVIDSDGHWKEIPPILSEQLRRIGGDKAAAALSLALQRSIVGRKQEGRQANSGWWLNAGSTLDRATAAFPRLLYSRMEELGFDFIVLYPSWGLTLLGTPDDKMRRAACNAYNTYIAEEFSKFSHRITPASIIPMNTPDEAIAELEHVAGLGLKVVTLWSLIRREDPTQKSSPTKYWLDTLGIDSPYNYDPVWAKLQELHLAPAFHTVGYGQGLRRSPSNFCYNNIGQFAEAGEAVCKALFIGGVTRRFPKLRFAFLEGGVAWACNLYSGLVAHWHVRNAKAVQRTNPGALDRQKFLSLAEKYGSEAWAKYWQTAGAKEEPSALGRLLTIGYLDPPAKQFDDYAACGIERPEDIRDLFAPNFYFGCEADDPVAPAFDTRANPYGARLNAMFSSDISHFDIPDMSGVLPEAYELIEHGLLDENDFRDFVFGNSARFLTSANPDFFAGTAIERAVKELLGEKS